MITDPTLQALMAEGMVIDVDHMSERTRDHVVAFCSAAAAPEHGVPPYPVISAHSGLRSLAPRRNFVDKNDPGTGQRSNSAMWPNESHKSLRALHQVLDLGGMIAPIPAYLDLLSAAGCPVDNNCPGTSRTYAQSLHFAHTVSAPYNRPIAVGTDMLLNRTPGPRFGPRTAQGTVGEPTDHGPSVERHNEAVTQRAAVVYSSGLHGKPRFYRFNDTDVAYLPPTPGVTGVDHQLYAVRVWNALWLQESGADPTGFDDDTRHLLAGFEAAPGANPNGLTDDGRLAFKARHAPGELDLSDWKAATIFASVTTFDQRSTGGNLDAPLQRCVAGSYGFDVNFDGLAHYGLLPDLIQDLRNVGLAASNLNALFNSAEAYLQIWETCRQNNNRIRKTIGQHVDTKAVEVAARQTH